ncbi:MAG: DedA family protein [Candidatus Peregrinibacteria bacterium Gr01-1014_25]|nr:MAG: DedA family protein [Candidatus Peregrinibacteria bacterium Gr01-1014_25]
MLEQLTATAGDLIHTYGVLGVFLASIVEEVIAPIPSAGVVLLAGFLLIPPEATWTAAAAAAAVNVMIPASIGLTVGSLFPYGVARIGGKLAVDKCGRLLGIDWSLVERAQARFTRSRSDELLLFGVRCVPVIPSVVIGVLCGLVRLPLPEFILFTFLGSLVRTFILALVGWSASAAYSAYAEQFSRGEDIVLGIIAIAIVAFALRWHSKRKQR